MPLASAAATRCPPSTSRTDCYAPGDQTAPPARRHTAVDTIGIPCDWHVTVHRIVGEGQHAASWIEFTGQEGTQPGLCFFELGADGRIAGITDFWPDPYELPASRADLVERY